jgi:predicted anti-sigma-YlaC factor YlaD
MNNPYHISEEELWEYADQMICNTRQLEIEKHLQQCGDCRLALEEITAFNTDISDIVIQEPSVRFSKNVMEFIEEEVESVTYRPLLKTLWLKILGSGFSAFIVGILTFGFTKQKTDIVWMDTVNDFIGSAFSGFYGLVASGIGMIVILIAFWLLFILDKLYLSKRFG